MTKDDIMKWQDMRREARIRISERLIQGLYPGFLEDLAKVYEQAIAEEMVNTMFFNVSVG